MSKIIAFIGPKKSGKDYNCGKLVVESGFLHVNFADELKEVCWDILNWRPKDNNEYELFKQGKIYINCFGYINGRLFLQNLGTEAIRKRDSGFWANCWYNRIKTEEGRNICCSDVRFLNEIDKVLKFDNEFYFTNYTLDVGYDLNDYHESERLSHFILSNGYGKQNIQRLSDDDIRMIFNNFEDYNKQYQIFLDNKDFNGLKKFRGF